MPEGVFLRGGVVIDGTGAPPCPRDVLVEGDRIAAVLPRGAEAPSGTVEYDVTGLHVTPGFIDVHSHDDLEILREPQLLPKLSQGVTTVVVGNCGHGTAPVGVASPYRDGLGRAVMGPFEPEGDWRTFADYLDLVDAAQPSVNVAALAAHNAIRIAVCGFESRPATDVELAAMVGLANDACRDGALGLSTGLGYEPARAANSYEIVALAAAFADGDGLYVTHLRDEADRVLQAVDEALDIGRRSGCRVHVSHLKCAGEPNWGKMSAILQRLSNVGATADVYPYTAASTALRPSLDAVGEAPLIPENYVIATAVGLEEVEGKSLAELAEVWECTGLEAAHRILEATGDVATVVYFTMAENDVATAIASDLVVIGSDGLPVGGHPHPRMYGTFPRVLSRYVAGPPHLSFEAAVERMTARPAAIFGLERRGQVAPGHYADLVLVDRHNVVDRATYESPRVQAAGIEAVLVNGQWAFATDDRPVARAGRTLRRTQRNGSVR
jgi:N-acyl-D-amino-acid deacylase